MRTSLRQRKVGCGVFDILDDELALSTLYLAPQMKLAEMAEVAQEPAHV
jgi:hypothetical protein